MTRMAWRCGALSALLGAGACVHADQSGSGGAGVDAQSAADGASTSAHLPLVLVADVDLPGGATRFDYQEVDTGLGHLVIAHMNDGNVVVANLSDGSVVTVVPNVPTARGIVVADDVGLFFVTSSPNQLVAVDNKTHCINEFRRLSGRTPPAYANDRFFQSPPACASIG